MSQFAVVDNAWRAIESTLAEPSQLNAAACRADVEAMEALFGSALPAAFVHSLGRHDGQPANAKPLFGSWKLLDARTCIRELRVWRELLASGDFKGQVPKEQVGISPCWWHPAWLPITHDGAGNHDCLDLAPAPGGRRGQVIRVWHDDPTRTLAAKSFGSWLAHHASTPTRGTES